MSALRSVNGAGTPSSNAVIHTICSTETSSPYECRGFFVLQAPYPQRLKMAHEVFVYHADKANKFPAYSPLTSVCEI